MIYVELVPKDIPQLVDDCHWIRAQFPNVVGINLPDILQVPNRSTTTATTLSGHGINALPHIRVCDFSKDALIATCQQLHHDGIHQVLLISGDPPPNPLQPVFQHNITDIIRLVCTHCPTLTVYAGYDPYRQSFKTEIEYAKQKLDAGASGLFTQPIFNPHMAHMLIEQCQPCEWFVGISPVLTEKSHAYWVTRNNVVFPPNVELSLEYNINLAKELLSVCNAHHQHNYIMPITTPIATYLPALFKA